MYLPTDRRGYWKVDRVLKTKINSKFKLFFLFKNSRKTTIWNDINNRPSDIINIRKIRNKTINKISYFLFNSLNKSLNQR